MGYDDAGDCDHDWTLTEVHVPGLVAADTASRCRRCGRVRYEAATADVRPPLGAGET